MKRSRLLLLVVTLSLAIGAMRQGPAQAVICPSNQCNTSADCVAVCGVTGGACVAGSPYIGGACGSYKSCRCNQVS